MNRLSSVKFFFTLLLIIPISAFALAIFLIISFYADQKNLDLAAVFLLFMSALWLSVLVFIIKLINNK